MSERNHYLTKLLLTLCIWNGSLLGTTLGPCTIPQSAFDQIVSHAAASEPNSADAALTILRSVAEGRGETVRESDEAAVGLAPTFFENSDFKQLPCRAEAFLAIGSLASDSAIDYLETLGKGNFKTPHELAELWPAVQVGLHAAKLTRQPGPSEQVAFLEVSLHGGGDPIAGAHVAMWAITELCDRGEVGSFPLVARAIRERWSGLSGEEQVRFCRARMDLVNRNPDRTAAFASALRAEGLFIDHALINWAILKLTRMKTQRSQEILESFALEVYAMPEDSPRRRELLTHAGAAWYRNGLRPPPQ